ncbi:hypothetical protein [Pseudonocardia sp. TRM90224]|uniref:hypothetical protein n=1 Tax=Pseudonocardia sp. TRM90224 TaxID=2812678 RepID=UPI001E351236|nr:hypothetical protein [Pseudonocardia sp. TRM90224]
MVVLVNVLAAFFLIAPALVKAMGSAGTSSDRAFMWLIAITGVTVLGPIALVSVVQAIRIAMGSPTAHRVLANCAGATGTLAVVIAGLSTSARGDLRAAVYIVAFAVVMFALRSGVLRLLRNDDRTLPANR